MIDEQSRGRPRTGLPAGRVRLLDAVPDLAGFLTADERPAVEQISVPVLRVEKGTIELSELLESRGAFAAAVVDGLMLHYLAIAAEPGLLILGPGDVVLPARASAPELLTSTRYRAPASTQLALLGTDALIAAGRAPRVVVGLLDLLHRQRQRLATQLVICQLPRVADRVQAMLWLLAESFGRVTPSGTRLPLSLTHEVLGALVGARRPTVTLAVGELAERGAVIHQDGSWMLLEPPSMIGDPERRRILEEPGLVIHEPSAWAAAPEPAWGAPQALVALIATVHQLQGEHGRNIELVAERLRRAKLSREHSSELVRRVRAQRGLSPRSPPST